MSVMKRCDFSYLPPWVLCHITDIHMALSDVNTVKETTITPLCSSQCWCSTKPWLWGIGQIFLYSPPGTSASWSLLFDRAGFLQASWLVIYMTFFVVIFVSPYSHCLLMSWFEVTSCSQVQSLVQSLCTLLSDCWSGNWALLLGRSKVTKQHQILACRSKLWRASVLGSNRREGRPCACRELSQIQHFSEMPLAFISMQIHLRCWDICIVQTGSGGIHL